MIPTDENVQVVLVVENPNHLVHAASALTSTGIGWIELQSCAATVEWLRTRHADLVLLLLQSTAPEGLTYLRQYWHGPLLCLCDEDDETVAAVEAADALALLPPFSKTQIISALRFFLKLSKTFVTTHESAHERELEKHVVGNEALLLESERRLEHAQRMEAVGRLAGGIAHDFNNLLTVIGSYSDLSLLKLDTGHIVARYVEQIRKASATASTLTSQLLAFGRRQVLQPKVIALNEIVDEISFMVQSLLGAGIELRMRLDRQLGQIEADPVQLQQVLLNLIVNAKDAMPEGGLLCLETCNVEVDARYARQFSNVRAGSYVRLTVADTGIGMDAPTLARIYEPFFTTKSNGRGTGLGLPTVYGIVQQSGGHISVYSEVGKGTTFHIHLPRVDRRVEHVDMVTELDGLVVGRETILLVEDEKSVRELASLILQEAGYRLLSAATPEEAMVIERSFDDNIDLLLTDMIMPRITGREVATQVAQHRPRIPVVYMSGYTEDTMAFRHLLDTGAYLIEKPFYPNDLLRTVRRAIDQSPDHAPRLIAGG
jgi:signal transduction histidine kinase